VIIGFVIGLVMPFLVDTGMVGFGQKLLAGLVYGLLFAGIGGMFIPFVKFYFGAMWECLKSMFDGGIAGLIGALIGFSIACTIGIFKCLFTTIINTVKYIRYMKRTDGFIESDSAALRMMKDYMAYTQIRQQHRGTDLQNLLTIAPELQKNRYVRLIMKRGEEAAAKRLANAADRAAANGEIINRF